MSTYLKTTSLFKDFSADELALIEEIAHRSTAPQGEYIFRENDESHSLIIVNMGTLKLMKKDDKGEDVELALLGSGTYLGEMSFVSGETRSTSAFAVEHCELISIEFGKLKKLLNDNSEIAAKLYKRIAIGITRRLSYMNEDSAALKSFLSNRV